MQFQFLASDFLDLLSFMSSGIFSFWWLILFFFLAPLAPALWLAYTQRWYRKSIKYMLLELKMPREVRKTPRAMEQVFTAIHALRNSPANTKEKWWDGEIVLHYSCEIVSFGGEVHFYMWIPQNRRNMIEAALYSQYADVEIVKADDYTTRFPATYRELEKQGYGMFGNELLLAKEDVLPIRTYIDFEAVAEEKELDPISGMLEMLGGLKPQEQIWIQFIVQPLVDFTPMGPNEIKEWETKGQEAINLIKGKSRTVIDKETGMPIFTMPSPAETDAMKAIDRTIGKPGFHTVIRYIYIAPKEMYTTNFGQRGVYSALNQYATESFNKFKHNVHVWTRASMWYSPYVFPKLRLLNRRERMWRRYHTRKIYDDTRITKILDLGFFAASSQGGRRIILNTEELATLFHLPTFIILTAPTVKRVESKKAGPPAGLPIYGGKEEELPGIKN